MIIDNDFEIITPDNTGIVTIGGTGAVTLPSGTTAQRSGSPVGGMLRYNTDVTPYIEAYANAAWVTLGGGGSGTVTSVAVSGGTTGLTTSGGPITGAGTLTLAGTLAVANGGTGQTTATAAFDALAPTQTGNSGKYLTTNGTTVSWATPTVGGGSGATTGTAILNFGTIPGSSSTSVVVTGQASILSTAFVDAWVNYTGPTGVLFGDGVNWTAPIRPTTMPVNSIVYGAGVYVMGMAYDPTAALYSSASLNTLLPRTSTLGTAAIFLTYLGNAFFASGYSGTFARSTDGITWADISGAFGVNQINSVAYSGSSWVAVGAAGNIATSPDGITWTIRTSPTTLNITSVAYGNGTWVAVSNNLLKSTDGINWFIVPKTFFQYLGTAPDPADNIAFGGGKFVVIINQQAYWSTDATNWYACTLDMPARYNDPFRLYGRPTLYRVMYGNGTWMATGSDGLVSISHDGVDWSTSFITPLTPIASTPLQAGYWNGMFILPGVAGYITTSPDVSREHTAYEHSIVPINIAISDIVPGVGFTITAVSQTRVTGTFTVKWSWSN